MIQKIYAKPAIEDEDKESTTKEIFSKILENNSNEDNRKSRMSLRIENEQNEVLRNTIYRIRGQQVDDTKTSTFSQILKFCAWFSLLVLTPTLFGVVLFAIPVVDIYEKDPDVRRNYITYMWCNHAWISIVHGLATTTMVDFYVIIPIFESQLKWSHRIFVIMSGISGAIVGVMSMSWLGNPEPFAWFWALNLLTAGVFSSSYYVIKHEFVKKAPEKQDLITDRIIVMIKLGIIGMTFMFIYVAYYICYQNIKQYATSVEITLYTLLIFIIKKIHLYLSTKLIDTHEFQMAHPLQQFWVLCIYSYFMTLVLSTDSSWAQMIMIFILDWISVFLGLFEMCFNIEKIKMKAEKNEEEHTENEDEDDFFPEEYSEEENCDKHVCAQLYNQSLEDKSAVEMKRSKSAILMDKFQNAVMDKSTIIMNTLENALHSGRTHLGEGRRLTIELISDGTFAKKASLVILYEFIEILIPITYFCIMYGCSFLPNFKYILSITSDEFGYSKVEDMPAMWNSILLLIAIEAFSFITISVCCKYLWGIQFFGVILYYLESYGWQWLGLSLSSFFALFGLLYEPWANDITFEFQYLKDQRNFNSTSTL